MFGSRKKKKDPDPRARENVDKQDYKLIGGVYVAAAVIAAPAVAVALTLGTVVAVAAIADAAFGDS